MAENEKLAGMLATLADELQSGEYDMQGEHLAFGDLCDDMGYTWQQVCEALREASALLTKGCAWGELEAYAVQLRKRAAGYRQRFVTEAAGMGRSATVTAEYMAQNVPGELWGAQDWASQGASLNSLRQAAMEAEQVAARLEAILGKGSSNDKEGQASGD